MVLLAQRQQVQFMIVFMCRSMRARSNVKYSLIYYYTCVVRWWVPWAATNNNSATVCAVHICQYLHQNTYLASKSDQSCEAGDSSSLRGVSSRPPGVSEPLFSLAGATLRTKKTKINNMQRKNRRHQNWNYNKIQLILFCFFNSTISRQYAGVK